MHGGDRSGALSRARHAAHAVNGALSFRTADPDSDLELAREIHHAAYREVVERQFGDWNLEAQDQFFLEGWHRATHELILLDGAPIGIASVSRSEDEIFFNELQILPEHQGRGIGTWILRRAMMLAAQCNRPLRLRVLRENRAVGLYRRLGFTELEPTETHLRFEWRAEKSA